MTRRRSPTIASLTVGAVPRLSALRSGDQQGVAAVVRAASPRKWPAAVSKLMRNQDLILVARKCEVFTAFRDTIGMRGRMSTRLQPNHPFDDARGITASILDGLLARIGRRLYRHQPSERRSGGDRRTAAIARRNSFRGSRFRPRAAC